MSIKSVFIFSLGFLLVVSHFNLAFSGGSAEVYLFLTPPAYIAKEIGEIFDIALNISNVKNLFSLGFTLVYNTSLLDVVKVEQGQFFPSPPRAFFQFEINEALGYVRVNMSLVESQTGRSGNGTLSLISFKVVQAPESCIGSPLELRQTLLLDSALNPIAHDQVGAVFFWKSLQPDPSVEGRVLDIYTNKGGIGLNKLGGNFMAGELVYLVSLVTYNNCPVQWKLVAFEVRNPMNETVVIRTAITDEHGVATISFRVPALPSSNGTWTAISTVDIACNVVWDTISFNFFCNACWRLLLLRDNRMQIRKNFTGIPSHGLDSNSSCYKDKTQKPLNLGSNG